MSIVRGSGGLGDGWSCRLGVRAFQDGDFTWSALLLLVSMFSGGCISSECWLSNLPIPAPWREKTSLCC